MIPISSDREILLELARNEIRLGRELSKDEIEYITKKIVAGDKDKYWVDMPDSLKKPFHKKFEKSLRRNK